jgi:hypothetical protein
MYRMSCTGPESDTYQSLALSPVPRILNTSRLLQLDYFEPVVFGGPRQAYFGEIYKAPTRFEKLNTVWLAV